MTLQEIETLGRELRRLHQIRHVEHCRKLWRAVRNRRALPEDAWSHEHAERVASILGVGPNPMKVSAHCPTCPPPAPGVPWNGSRAVAIVAHRVAFTCANCGTEWVSTMPASRTDQRQAQRNS